MSEPPKLPNTLTQNGLLSPIDRKTKFPDLKALYEALGFPPKLLREEANLSQKSRNDETKNSKYNCHKEAEHDADLQ